MIETFEQFVNESIAPTCELYRFKDWKEFQDTMNNTIGWENQTLRKSSHWKHVDGKKYLDINDPAEGSVYYGMKDNGVFVGYTNVYEDDTIWISDFEIFKNIKGKGYGRAMFELLKSTYPDKSFELTFGDKNAKLFWERMGFVRQGATKTMMYTV